MRSTTRSNRLRQTGSTASSRPDTSPRVGSIDEASATSRQQTLLDLDSDTSLPASADGPMHSDLPAFPTMPTSGPARARVNRSRPRARGAERATLDIFGQHGSHSSSSVVLQSSLESRLRAKMGSHGSILFSLTWNDAVTPSGRRICALRASAPRIFDSDSTSWPTPTAEDAQSSSRVGYAIRSHTGITLTDAARSTWPTPQSRDGNQGGQAKRAMGDTRHGSNLDDFAQLAGWTTPVSTELGNTLENYRAMKRNMRSGARTAITHLSLQAQLADSGRVPNGFPASTESRGQLSPAHSRWLMGYPAAWDDCAGTATRSFRKSPRRSSERRTKRPRR